MVVDKAGFRLNVGIILLGPNERLFWGRRFGRNAWQFPQGGLQEDETPEQAMYRELKEEVGLDPEDVELIASTQQWLYYRLPKHFLRRHSKPLVIGQKQKWFLLKLKGPEEKICLTEEETPEFDQWRWVNYWYPLKEVIYFKRRVYRKALREFEPFFKASSSSNSEVPIMT